MFQKFEVTSTPDTGPARLTALRAEITKHGLDGFLVPRADRFQGEYVAPCDDRLAWLTSFTGSAGFACILAEEAGIFIDGRYRLQVRDQVADVYTPVHWPEVELSDWLAERATTIDEIAFDPWLHTVAQIKALTKALAKTGITLRPSDNLIDRIWQDRPPPPAASFSNHPVDLAGESSVSKLERLAETLRDSGQRAAFIAAPDSVAWLLNLRGADIPRNPVPHAMALLKDSGDVILFCDPDQAEGIELDDGVTVVAEDQMQATLSAIDLPVRIDADRTPYAIKQILIAAQSDPAQIIYDQDPCVLPKAQKNAVEIAGAREAHLRDGAAMARFLAWLDREAPTGHLSEIDVVKALETFRRDTNALLDISFETISGSGPNGAIVHYRVSETSNRAVKSGELLLVDSGGQYKDGTTDITRTIGIGQIPDLEKRRFTRVLQGMINVSRARFPQGVGGNHLDALARYPLWLEGLDYDHGTGHGVGSYLCVHEGPQGLSRKATTPLMEGMILSNEPGYYKEGAFGIRIENLIVVQPAPAIAGADDRKMLTFETLTFAPIDRNLIVASLLSSEERDWIDRYHADTLRKIGPRVDAETLTWLTAACAPL